MILVTLAPLRRRHRANPDLVDSQVDPRRTAQRWGGQRPPKTLPFATLSRNESKTRIIPLDRQNWPDPWQTGRLGELLACGLLPETQEPAGKYQPGTDN